MSAKHMIEISMYVCDRVLIRLPFIMFVVKITVSVHYDCIILVYNSGQKCFFV